MRCSAACVRSTQAVARALHSRPAVVAVQGEGASTQFEAAAAEDLRDRRSARDALMDAMQVLTGAANATQTLSDDFGNAKARAVNKQHI